MSVSDRIADIVIAASRVMTFAQRS